MDQSQYIRLKAEAANVYASRMKTVDASFLTMQRQQKAAYSGRLQVQVIPYFNGSPVVTPILYDISSCPQNHRYVQGFTSVNNVAMQELRASEAAGAVLCCQPDYSIISPGVQLKNCAEVSTILTQFNNLTPAPGEYVAYGYGQNYYRPSPDSNTGTVCSPANRLPYPSG